MADVALDPGHSSWDVGATGAGLRELDLTLDVAQRVRSRLEDAGLVVRLSREDDRRVAASVPANLTDAIRVEQFARHAVVAPARAFLSIHFNGHPDRRLRGTETYYNAENYGDPSRMLATSVHESTLRGLRSAGYESNDRGVREDLTAGKPYGHFFSLRGPCPSALVEALFLSNDGEATLLRDVTIREALAAGIAHGLEDYLTVHLGPAR